MECLNIIIIYIGRYLSITLLTTKFLNLTMHSILLKLKIILLILITSLIYLFCLKVFIIQVAILISLIFYVIGFSIIFKTKFTINLITIFISYMIIIILYFIILAIPIMLFSYLILNNQEATFMDYRLLDIGCLYLTFQVMKLNKLKKGISYLNNNSVVKYLIIKFFSIILFVLIYFFSLNNFHNNYSNLNYKFIIFLIFIATFMLMSLIILIKKEFDNYFKQEANTRTIENLLKMVDDQKEEINRLTEVSKISHKTNHQIDILKGKLNNSDNEELINELNKISESYKRKINSINKVILLQSTNIKEIDDVLEYMLSEANKNKIDLVIRINGSVNYMVKNYINIDKLCTILSDHLKNAIISINHSKNPFRSITLTIGEIGDYYGVAILDTGIEFKINTLVNLGLKATTTHKKDGGTGIGFLTTFETIKEIKGSLIIDERKPEDYNYTKTITMLFDDRTEYKISSYRYKLINSKNKKNKIIVTKNKMF